SRSAKPQRGERDVSEKLLKSGARQSPSPPPIAAFTGLGHLLKLFLSTVVVIDAGGSAQCQRHCPSHKVVAATIRREGDISRYPLPHREARGVRVDRDTAAHHRGARGLDELVAGALVGFGEGPSAARDRAAGEEQSE